MKPRLIQIVTRDTLVKLISTNKRIQKGAIFSLRFTKKDNTERKMVCRFGVTSELHGGKSNLNPDKFFTVFDLQKHEYRAVNKETIMEATVCGITYKVIR